MSEVDGRGKLSRLHGEVLSEEQRQQTVERVAQTEAEILKHNQVMELLGIKDTRTLKRAINEGGLPGRFVGSSGDVRNFRTTRTALLRWLGGEDTPQVEADAESA